MSAFNRLDERLPYDKIGAMNESPPKRRVGFVRITQTDWEQKPDYIQAALSHINIESTLQSMGAGGAYMASVDVIGTSPDFDEVEPSDGPIPEYGIIHDDGRWTLKRVK